MANANMFTNSEAIALINSAITANTIKLKGCNLEGDTKGAIDNAEIDAAYLLTLLTRLQLGLET